MKADMTQVQCDNCGESIWKSPYIAKINKHNFCDRQCFYEWKRKNPQTSPLWRGGKAKSTCDNCGKPIEFTPCLLKEFKHHFCNKECYDEWQRQNTPSGADHPRWTHIIVHCAHCNAPLERKPSKVAMYKNQFCNQECRGRWQSKNHTGANNSAWRGGYEPYYGPNWREQRRLARKRDNYTCQLCGLKEYEHATELHVHHIIPFSDFDGDWESANELDNLITFCQVCHLYVEWCT